MQAQRADQTKIQDVTHLANEHLDCPASIFSKMAATVTDLISTTITTLVAATDHYNVVKDDKGLREAFHEAGRGLLLVRQALQAAKTQLAGRDAAGNLQNAPDSLKACNTNAKLSKTILNAVAQAPENSRFDGYKEAVIQEGKRRKIEVVMMGMMNDVCTLAKDCAIRAEMEDQVNGLRSAIERLSKMEPSVPNERSGHSFTHFGSGDQLNAPGGTVNKSTGEGKHFPGASFFGPVQF
ncbi:hypothetical protein BKA56DRAFT_584530 [Ilyonectria sp. MPI-CAGE-AT-0026]|nr:hypothetical protein BKA56DRAFT_584530 [Ilyonectria sp. MPI-CAGE-AT-0026]